MNVRDVSYIRMGFYPTGIQAIKDLVTRFGHGEIISKIDAKQKLQDNGFISIRLSVTEWETVSDAFLEHANDAWEASVASEINERLQHHGWR